MNIDSTRWHAPSAPGGPSLSRLVQGYWRMDRWDRSIEGHLDFLKAHLDLGVTTIDHADIYGDYEVEALFGKVLALDPALRERMQLVSKCDIQLLTAKAPGRRLKHYDTGAAHITASVENSLQRLGTDRLDLLLLHRPDPLMAADEVARAFQDLKAAGKVRHFGVSNFTPTQFDLLQDRLDAPLATNQVEINPVSDTVFLDGTLEHLQQHRVRPMGWSCLAGGRLFDPNDEAGARCRAALERVGEELGGYGVDQVAFAWVLRLPCHPLPIIGSGQLERVRLAVAASAIEMSREQWFAIWEAGRGVEVP